MFNNLRAILRRDVAAVVVISLYLFVGVLLLFPKPVTGSSLPSNTSLFEIFSDSTDESKGYVREEAPQSEPPGDNKFPDEHPKSVTDSVVAFPLQDSAYVVYRDSTARMAQFTYRRHDQPQVKVFSDWTYPLFAANRSLGYKREVKMDSSGTKMLFHESVGGEDVKVPVELPLQEYIRLKRRHELRKMLASEARKAPELTTKKDIGELMSTITKIQIPIPSNPIFSIFGKPEINLNISGAVDIKAGFRNTKSDQTQVSRLDQTRNEPDFSQEVQVNVNGTVGDKLNILADWNTQRTFEYENQLKIKYTGYDDEIVQSVEAGNVSLQTPSSYVGSSQALFGVKARFQTGPLTLTTLASQKKGQIKEVSVSGGAQEVPFEFNAWNYATNHFFVDTLPYRSYYEPYYTTEPVTITGDMVNSQIVDEEVWVELTNTDPTQLAVARRGIAYITLPPRGTGYDSTLRTATGSQGTVETGRFIRLDPSQYDLDKYLGIISLPSSIQDQQIVAIAYRRADDTQFGEFARNLPPDTSANKPLIFKMIKPRNLNSAGRGYPLAWEMMLKSIYNLPGIGRNLKREGFTLDIFRITPGQEDQNSILNERLLRVFGFDNYNSDDAVVPNGDGQFDFRPGRTINQARAFIIFPSLRPFDTGMKEFFRDVHVPSVVLEDTSEYLFKEIYDTTRTVAQQSFKYVVRGKATGEVSSKYNLGFNVVEGSVQVLLDGQPLVPNLDYTVDYIIGEIVIRNDRALVPGANLQIKYEQNDLFQLASKTLLAARGDLALSQSTNIGFTVMNLNQQTLSDKVRLGEEPNRNTIFGVDGATSVNLPFLTKSIDALPLLQTRESSNLRISGEAAYMLPDPNTKKSTIASDEGQSIAYIDDFEGAKRTIPLGINYTQWTQASPPADSVSGSSLGVADSTKMLSKGKVIWYNVLPTNVRLTDVYPEKRPGNPANDVVTVLDFKYSPFTRGQFNYSPDLTSTLTPTKNWGGVMKPISITATNLINENINFIELWMRVEQAPQGTKMIVDLGTINERVIPTGGRNSNIQDPNSEDLVLSQQANGTLQQGEDVGLDMRTNAEELAYIDARYGSRAGFDVNDPSGDDYFFNNQTNDYTRINGTQDNKNGPNGLIPDTEDLNLNGLADERNSYIEYEIPLDTVRSQNPTIVGGGSNGWYQFRVPIRDYSRLVGTNIPNFENVEYIRVFFLNASDTVHVRIADFSLVGNQWQELDKSDTTFAVSVVSVEENPSTYRSPPGVIREQDRTRPDENVQANEQSLALQLKGIPPRQSRQAVKYYTLRPLDLFNYKSMKMYVHTDDSFEYIDSTRYDADIFFRFGLDSLNFYEYRAPLRQAPLNDNWSEISIIFADLTVIKQVRGDSTQRISDPLPVPGGPEGAVYRVLGNPSLTQVRYLSVGVTNKGLRPIRPGDLYGEVWINELRLTSVDDSPGWAYRFDTQLKLADLGTVAFNYSKQDPNFHRLEERFGSRQTGTNWGLNATMSLDKFLPNDWVGTTIPVSYSRTINKVVPKYLPNSDVLVTEAASLSSARILNEGGTQAEADAEARRVSAEAETYRVTDTYAAPSFRIGFPSQAWYIRDTFNKLTFGFTYTRTRENNPAIARRLSWSWNTRISYAITFSPDYYFSPFTSLFKGLWFLDEYKDMKIFFTPTNFNWSFGATRSRDISLLRVRDAQETISRNFTANRQFGFAWKFTEGGLTNLTGSYNLSIESSLLDLETDRFMQQRRFSRILDDIFFGDRFINFGKDTRYTQQNQFNSRPNIPNIFNIKKYLDLTFGYNVDYAWQNTLQQGDISKSAGFTNRISGTMNFRLKSLFDPLFEDKPSSPSPFPRGRRGGEQEGSRDSTHAADTTDTSGPGGLDKALTQIKQLAKIFIKIPLLDYDNISVTFTQDNAAQNSGVVGRPGFVNFWGRVPFFEESKSRYGPSRLYQLGLISDPHGRLTNFGSRSHFPYFGWDVEPGIRAANAQLANTYRQSNRLTFKTTRGLWEGAKLDLNWNIGWQYSRTQNVRTDSLGIPTIQNSTTTGSIDRSFLTFPDVLFLGLFKSSLKDVGKRYGELKNQRDSSISDEEKIAKAFEEGFEALPFMRKIFGQYAPRVNWNLRWDGLERLPLFSSFVSRLSLDHAYGASYARSFRNLPGGGGERTDNQRVSYGFTPLVGLNFTFKELLKGSFGANLRYATTTGYDLSTASRNIVESFTREVTITTSYTRRGFEIPLFGLSLNNDVDISTSYSVAKTSRKTYDVTKLDVNLVGSPLDGQTRTTIEPRIKYVLSSRVTASIYYRYVKIAPDDSGSRIPGSTSNEAGLDIHIAIQ